MALSRITYIGDGATNTYVFPFDYINESHISVLVNDDEADFDFLSSNTVQLLITPANGDEIIILRTTPIEELLVDFVNGSELDADDFDLANTQLLYIQQENQDAIADGVIVTVPDATETVKGKARLATAAETVAGTDDTTIITPLKLQQKIDAIGGGSETLSVGTMVEAHNNPQSGKWIKASGQTIDQATYSTLFAVLGDDSRILDSRSVGTTDNIGVSSGPAFCNKIAGRYIISSNGRVHYSVDGENWVQPSIFVAAQNTRFANSGSRVIVNGGDGFNPETGSVSYSDDGILWTEVPNVGGGALIDCWELNGFFFTIEQGTGQVYKSSNATSWTPAGMINTVNYIPVLPIEHLGLVVKIDGTEIQFYEFNGDELELTQVFDNPLDFDSSIRLDYNAFRNELGIVDSDGTNVDMVRLSLSTGRAIFKTAPLPAGSLDIESIKWISGDMYLLGTDTSGAYKSDLSTIDNVDFASNQDSVTSIVLTGGDELLLAGRDNDTAQPIDILNLTFDLADFKNASSPINFGYSSRDTWIKFD